MQNLLTKLAALGILVGGFALTGDLGWLVARAQRVIGAAEVASAPSMAFLDAAPLPSAVAAPAAQPPAPSEPEPVPQAPAVAFTPIATSSPPTAPPTSSPMPVAEFKPPAGGSQSVAIADLRPGDRVVVWLGSTRHRCLVFDLVEPSAGGALVYEAAAVNRQGQPLAASGPPRRVVVSGAQPAGGTPGRLIRGGSLHVAEAGVAGSDQAAAWLGPIESLAVIK